MPTDFAPHNMTTDLLPWPYIAFGSSSFSGSFDYYEAFDGAVGSGQYWLASGNTGYVALDSMAYGYLLDNYTVRVNTIPEPNRAPQNWTLDGSNDRVTWTTVDTQTGQTGWTSGQSRNFVCATRTTSYRFFRINITLNNGDSLTGVAELYLFGTYTATYGTLNPAVELSGNTTPSPYVVSASSVFTPGNEYYAFARSGFAQWIGTGGGTDWLQIDLGSGGPYLLGAYDVQTYTTAARSPKTWTMQGSNNGSTWTTVDTRASETSWGNQEQRNYHCATVTTPYRYFRINITANNGDATYTEIAQLYLFMVTGSAGAGGVFRASPLSGVGTGGKFFTNPLN